MAAPIRVAGIVFMSRDGTPYQLRGGVTVQPLNTNREAVMGIDGRAHGFKETPIIPYIEAEVTAQGFSVKALDAVTNSTVTVQLATGITYALRGAYFSGETQINPVEGTVKLRFEGAECVEI